MNLSGLHKEMDAFKFGFALTLSQARISWHALDLCSPAPATLFLAGAGHYRRPCSLQLSSSSVSTLFVVLFGFVTFKSLKEAVSDGSLTGDKRLGSSSSLSFWRYSLLGAKSREGSLAIAALGFSGSNPGDPLSGYRRKSLNVDSVRARQPLVEHRSQRTNSPFPSQGSRETLNSTKVAPFSFSGASLESISRSKSLRKLFTFLAFYLDTTPPPTCSFLIGGTVHLRRNVPGDLFYGTGVSKGFQLHFTSVWAWPNNIIKSDSPFSSLSRPKVMDEAELVQLFMVLTAWVALSEFSDEFTGISRACLWSYPSSENCLLMGSSD
ncbi:LOW QUALITY PROTEIN: hypothetical protein HID58_049100, partial [Brassica napus]